MKKAGILIIHYKDSIDTKDCLDSLVKIHTSTEFRVYLICVQSKEDPLLIHHPVKPVVIKESKNFGFAGANNLLIAHALQDGCDAVVLLNNDTTVDEHFLDPLLIALEKPQVGMVCPKIYFYPGNEFHHDSYAEQERGHVVWYAGGVVDWQHSTASHWGVDEVDHGQFKKPLPTDFATGCCLAIKADTIRNIGMMDNDYFLYYEDADWSRRAISRGFQIMVEPDSVIWHKNAGSTGGSGSLVHVYYQTRNRFRFGFRFAPFRTKLHLFLQLIKFLRDPEPMIRRAALDALIGRYGIYR